MGHKTRIVAGEMLAKCAVRADGLRQRSFKGLESRSNEGCGSSSDFKILTH